MLESEATEILKTDRAMFGNAYHLKNDWFTDEQFLLRRDREVYSEHPLDPSIKSGLYRREYNPLFGKRPTKRNRYTLRQDPWMQDGYESFDWIGSVFIPSWGREDKMVEGGQHYTWDIMLPNRYVPPACRAVVVL